MHRLSCASISSVRISIPSRRPSSLDSRSLPQQCSITRITYQRLCDSPSAIIAIMARALSVEVPASKIASNREPRPNRKACNDCRAGGCFSGSGHGARSPCREGVGGHSEFAQDLIEPELHARLKHVEGLAKGRTLAKESEAIRPVQQEHIDEVLLRVNEQIAAMIQLQLFTGARPGEVVIVRTGDIDRSGAVWLYTPRSHKTEHFGCDRTIFLGPRAQAIVAPFLKMDPQRFLFSPADAETNRRAELRGQRRSRTATHPAQTESENHAGRQAIITQSIANAA